MDALRRTSVLLCGVLLFGSAIPLSYHPLERFMYWTSLMSWPGYDPLLYWFPMVLWRPAVWWPSLAIAIAAVVAIAVLMRRRRFAHVVVAVSCAISLALVVQYAAITRLDDHVFWFATKGIVRGLPWEFSWPALFTCIGVAAAYSGIAAVLSAVIRVLGQRMAKA